MRDFICENCFIKVDGQMYDDNNIIDNLYYCNDCFNSKNKKYTALSGYKIKSYIDFETMEIKQND